MDQEPSRNSRAEHSAPLPLPQDLSSSQSKLVYLYLQVSKEATSDELTANLGLKRLSLLPTLNTLCESGLVERDKDTFTCTA